MKGVLFFEDTALEMKFKPEAAEDIVDPYRFGYMLSESSMLVVKLESPLTATCCIITDQHRRFTEFAKTMLRKKPVSMHAVIFDDKGAVAHDIDDFFRQC